MSRSNIRTECHKSKGAKGGKPLKDIENLIHKIEGMSVENLKVISELDLIINEIIALKEKYKIIDKL